MLNHTKADIHLIYVLGLLSARLGSPEFYMTTNSQTAAAIKPSLPLAILFI